MAVAYQDLFLHDEADTFVMVAAIDFGTTFSGYAFSFKTSPNDIKMNKSWGEGLGFQSYKTSTSVLVNPEGKFVDFGFDAEQKYSQLIENDKSTVAHQMYRHFKMSLHKDGVFESSKISSVSGVKCDAMDIFVMSLKYLKNHLLTSMVKQTTNAPTESLVKWVITVPAIWTDEAKQFMREAAYKADLFKTKNSTSLTIALEPEAASIYCRSLDHFSGGFGAETAEFKTGTKYIVVDAGGGTVDITAHEIMSTGQLKELHTASGGPWGGTKVDNNFIDLLKSLIGEEFIYMYQKECPHQWLNMMVAFEKAKKSCKADDDSRIAIPLNWSIGCKYMQMMGKDIGNVVNETGKLGVSFVNGSLVLENNIIGELFSDVTGEIVKHINALLKVSKLQHCEYLLLVGGFGECSFLQKAIQNKFNDKVTLLVPSEAQMSVIKGAVLYGHQPDNILSRVARKTYGTKYTERFQSAIHDIKYCVQDPFTNILFCRDVFNSLVQKGDEVEIGSSVNRSFGPISPSQNFVLFTLYAIDRRCSEYVTEYTNTPGFHEVGEIAIEIPPAQNIPDDRKVDLEFQFGGTEIVVQATDCSTGNFRQININFLAR